MQNLNDRPEVPLGLGYALAMNSKALETFANLSSERRKQVIEASRGVGSKKEMRQLVEDMCRETE